MINEKIKNLTKIFLKDYIEKFNILDEKNKINKKSINVWLAAIIVFCLSYISVKLIAYLRDGNVPELFFKIYLPIIAIFMLFQLIIIICSVFYYSKDLEYILPLPVKPIEILIAKFFTIIVIMYMEEVLFLLIPLIMYGILVSGSIIYFMFAIFVLAIFPVSYTSIISILILVFMRILKRIKNSNIKQLIIVITLTVLLGIVLIISLKGNLNTIDNATEVEIFNMGLDNINNYFIITEPITELLTEKNILNNLINILKIITINLMFLIILIFIGKKLYINNLLINYVQNNIKKIKKYKYKKIKKEKSYLKIETKKILKNTTYFTQNVFNYINIIILALIIIFALIPIFIQQLQSVNYLENTNIEQFKIEVFGTVIAVMQIISTFNNLSITAVSKEGKEAVFMKYIPMSLYKQFVIKTIPQIILNTIMTIMVLVVIFISKVNIQFEYYLIAFITGLLLNIINSFIMLLIDFNKPNLNWTNIESITKNNNKKMYQYVYTIFIILILIYFSKIFKNLSFIISSIIINIILILVILILKKYIKKNINKIFSKIY